MYEPQTDPRRGAGRDPALEIRRVCEAWRRAALIDDFDEVDALERTGASAAGPDSMDISARATHRVLAGAGNRTRRAFAIRHWDGPEKPPRGRSREFWLLSCRIVDDESVRADAEAIAASVEALRLLGLSPGHVKVRISHRDAVRSLLIRRGVDADQLDAWFPLLHRAGKMSNDDFISGALEMGMEAKTALDVLRVLAMSTPFENPTTQLFLSEQAGGRGPEYFKSLFTELRAMGVAEWCVLNLGIIRAGAHHTGMVFEIHDAGGRGRSIAGGGRSTLDGDKHVVGFDMGDTALLEVLNAAGIAPGAVALENELGTRIDVVVAAIDDPDALGALVPTVAALRAAGLRTRRLDSPVTALADLEAHARSAGGRGGRGAVYAVLIESGGSPGAAKVIRMSEGAEHARTASLVQLPDLIR